MLPKLIVFLILLSVFSSCKKEPCQPVKCHYRHISAYTWCVDPLDSGQIIYKDIVQFSDTVFVSSCDTAQWIQNNTWSQIFNPDFYKLYPEICDCN